MNQTKLESLLEAFTNILIGFGINYSANMVILPAYGMAITHSINMQIGLIYTLISLARSYVIRRWFNNGIHNTMAWISKLWYNKEKLND